MIEKPPAASTSATGPMGTDFGKIRDVADFHLHWPQFRPLALQLARKPDLSAPEADTLGWMIELMDRIGPKDLEDDRG